MHGTKKWTVVCLSVLLPLDLGSLIVGRFVHQISINRALLITNHFAGIPCQFDIDPCPVGLRVQAAVCSDLLPVNDEDGLYWVH